MSREEFFGIKTNIDTMRGNFLNNSLHVLNMIKVFNDSYGRQAFFENANTNVADLGEKKKRLKNEIEKSVDSISHQLSITLNVIGLGVDSESAPKFQQVEYGKDEPAISSSEIILIIKDRESFLNFLRSINKDKTDKQVLGFLNELIEMFNKQMDDITKDDLFRDEIIDLFSISDEILSEIKRISGEIKDENFGDQELIKLAEDFERKAFYAKKGCTREYLMLSAKGFSLDLPYDLNFKNQLKWHLDSDFETVENNWNRVISILSDVREKPNAEELFSIAVKTARDGVRQAYNDSVNEKLFPLIQDHERLSVFFKKMEDRLLDF